MKVALALLLACTPLAAQDLEVPDADEWELIRQRRAAAGATADDGIVLELYDIRDLARPDAENEPEPETAEELAERLERDAEAFEELADIVARYLVPPLTGPAQAIRGTRGGVLVANATAAQHEWIAAFLEAQRRAAGVLFDLQMKLIELEAGPFAELGLAEGPTVIDQVELRRLLERVDALPEASVLQAPRILIHNRARAEVQTLNEVAYVSDWRYYESVEPLGEPILDPVVELVEEGLTLDARPIRGVGGTTLIEVDFRYRDLIRMEKGKVQYGEIAMPVVSQRELSTSASLADDGVLLCTGMESEGREMILLLTVRAIHPVPGAAEPSPVEDDRRR